MTLDISDCMVCSEFILVVCSIGIRCLMLKTLYLTAPFLKTFSNTYCPLFLTLGFYIFFGDSQAFNAFAAHTGILLFDGSFLIITVFATLLPLPISSIEVSMLFLIIITLSSFEADL